VASASVLPVVTHPLASFPGTPDEPGNEATHPCVICYAENSK